MVAALVVCAIQPRLVLRPTFRDLRHVSAGGVAYSARNEGHTWYFLSPGAARAHQQVADAADRVSGPVTPCSWAPSTWPARRTSRRQGHQPDLAARFLQGSLTTS